LNQNRRSFLKEICAGPLISVEEMEAAGALTVLKESSK
jgi:hypothetical protein